MSIVQRWSAPLLILPFVVLCFDFVFTCVFRADVPQLSTKDYIQGVYQNYLDLANSQYAELKADKEAGGRK
jgi:hypothetical protein